jgi:hypothetical protein
MSSFITDSSGVSGILNQSEDAIAIGQAVRRNLREIFVKAHARQASVALDLPKTRYDVVFHPIIFLLRNSPMEGIAQAIFPKVFAATEI